MNDHDFNSDARAFAERWLGRPLTTMEQQALNAALADALARNEPATPETAVKVLRRLQASTGRPLSAKEQIDLAVLQTLSQS